MCPGRAPAPVTTRRPGQPGYLPAAGALAAGRAGRGASHLPRSGRARTTPSGCRPGSARSHPPQAAPPAAGGADRGHRPDRFGARCPVRARGPDPGPTATPRRPGGDGPVPPAACAGGWRRPDRPSAARPGPYPGRSCGAWCRPGLPGATSRRGGGRNPDWANTPSAPGPGPDRTADGRSGRPGRGAGTTRRSGLRQTAPGPVGPGRSSVAPDRLRRGAGPRGRRPDGRARRPGPLRTARLPAGRAVQRDPSMSQHRPTRSSA